MITKVKNTVSWAYVILVILMVKKLLKRFTKKNYKKKKKKNQKELKIETLYVTWKGYDNSFNGSINKKDIFV